MVKFLIHRPIAVLMTVLGVLILGIYAAGFIPVSLMPDIDIPEITVQVSDANLSARQLEDGIVKRLRNNLKQVSHVKDIKSETTNGLGIVSLSFVHGTKIDYSFMEVNEKVDRLMGSLPKTMERPKVLKASATDIPVFYLSMTLKEKRENKNLDKNLYPVSQDFVDFNRLVNQVIIKRIEQVNEVAMVDISGLVTSEILIIPDNEKLLALGLSLDELENTITRADIDIGNLSIKDSQYQYNIRLGSEVTNIRDIQNLYIKKDNRVYQLKDIAQVLEHPQKRKGLVLSNGEEAITMAIIKQHDARMGDLKEQLDGLLKQLRKDYRSIDFKVTRNQTALLDYAISNLIQSLFWGVMLSFGIMFLFLKNVKAPILIALVIPVSLVVCLLFFQVFNISVNIISLSGLVLGIGLMIDNSIIVIDNITQFRERGYGLSESCASGVNEVFRPLLSSALTTCAVFLPLIFISGITGDLFYDQAMAISIGLFVSLLVSITLLPVLYYLFHNRKNIKKGRLTRFLEKTTLIDYVLVYEKGFRWVMRNQKVSWVVIVFLLMLAFGLYKVLPISQMPKLSKTDTLVKIDWNEQINVDENKSRIFEVLNAVDGLVKDNTALVGSQQFILDKKTLARTSETTLYLDTTSPEILYEIFKKLSDFFKNVYPKALFKYEETDNIFNAIFPEEEAPLVARLRNIGGLKTQENEQLKEVWSQIQRNIDGDLELKPIAWQESMVLVADRERLLTYDVDDRTLFNTLKSAFGERVVLSLRDNQNIVPIVLGGELKSVQDVLNETTVISRDSARISTKEFLKVSKTQELKRIVGGAEGEYFPIEIFADSGNVENVQGAIKNTISQNKWYDVTFSGSFFDNKSMLNQLIIILSISLALLYFILASQFESFLLPLIILLEVPIDLAGAFLFLKLFGMGINLMSLIGMVVMCGIIINDSILKIDTVIQLQRQGYSILKALLVAGQRRLKPILMTSLTTILAVVPLLFSTGMGAELQRPLAVTLIGGMLLGTLVSIYFIPLCYYYTQTKLLKTTNKFVDDNV
ncbi:efflux RND transporter permease subunit [Aestuariibaculum sp. M13]|uniref:efflux RND transporter permease subunit n=1 Tax=Aestuariibaculum sp. M13 TaxID=2967132 RepID=UPI002159F760|nr:efflux RND transporter permease subunit [Aestuariibaculum sp. M13]MCR8667547.1 efflux RND transporter permease subunit [Aestuariibaculum sp. M13]